MGRVVFKKTWDEMEKKPGGWREPRRCTNPNGNCLLLPRKVKVAKERRKQHWAVSSTEGREEILCDSPLGDEKENTSFPRKRE